MDRAPGSDRERGELVIRRRPQILVIANWRDASHPDAGGAEACCEQLARRLASMGHRVVYLTSIVDGRPRRESRRGFELVRVGRRYSLYPLALIWLALNRRRINGVIDSQNGIPFFSPLALPARTPIVLLMHHVHQEQFASYLPGPAAALGRWLERVGMKWVYGRRIVAAMSPSTRRAVRRELGMRGPVHVVPPGWELAIDLDGEMQPRSLRPRIVCVGRLVSHKRPQLVIAAVAELRDRWPDLELHIVGDGPEAASLAQGVATAGLEDRVTLHGALDSDERDRLLSTAWLTVNTSQGEGWALTVVEANALGVPVVGLRVPGLQDSICHGETGWLVDKGESLADAMSEALTVMADPVRADATSLRARQWAARFDWQETALQMHRLLGAERGRLRHHSEDRRLQSDLAMVAQIPMGFLSDGWVPDFRGTDRVTLTEEGLAVLLPGTDTHSAVQALHRCGLPGSVVSDPRVEIRVARTSDHIFPTIAKPYLDDAHPNRATRVRSPR